MKYTGITYRPPFEADSLLLQVTRGCSHNRCTFCTMYRDVPFGIESEEQIQKDLLEAREFAPDTERVFLENGDAFCLSADKLKRIAEIIHFHLPAVKTIAMYASINNIRGKSDQDLKDLCKMGINDLNIGVESGFDPALKYMNKGFDAAQAKQELLRLREAGIYYGANIILGAAGAGMEEENALATARLLNATKPYLVFTGTIHADPGCPLYDDMKAGRFQEGTIGQYLDEEEIFLSQLELDDCYYFGLHPSNVVRMHGYLPEDKDKLLSILSLRRKQLSDHLDEIPERYGEGGIIF